MDHANHLSVARINRRRAVAGGTALAATPFLAGLVPVAAAAQSGATPAAVAGGTLRIGVQGDPTNLDPHLTVLAAAGVVIELVYDGLVVVDPGLNPTPALAESWTISEDGLTYTFALRSNATFHNGRQLVASDVEYSFNRVLDPEVASPSASYASGIAAIETPDDATVVITLAQPDASFLTKLCWWGMSIVPQEEVEANGDLSQTMVGTGAFVFEDYLPNTRITMVRHDGYWDAPKPYVDGLEVLIVPDDTARTTALISDSVDIIEQVPHKDIAILETNDAVELAGSVATNLRWLVFNLRKEPFSSLEFRQAVAAALDRDAIIQSAVFGYGEPLVGLYPPFILGRVAGRDSADGPGQGADVARISRAARRFRPRIADVGAIRVPVQYIGRRSGTTSASRYRSRNRCPGKRDLHRSILFR